MMLIGDDVDVTSRRMNTDIKDVNDNNSHVRHGIVNPYHKVLLPNEFSRSRTNLDDVQTMTRRRWHTYYADDDL